MSIIQTIREKGAKISVILIALALLGFILTDYVAGKSRGGFGGGSSTIVGRVNGRKIDLTEFENKVKQQEENQKQQGYAQDGEELRQQAIETIWGQEVNRLIITDEINKLGMQIGKKELGDILYGSNAPEDLKKQFTDEQTGQYNPAKAKAEIDNMLKRGKQEQKDNFNAYINQLEMQRMAEKYNSLFINSINYPKWFLEKQTADNSQLAKMSFVSEVYASIPDSSVKIADKDIEDYISKHKDDYKQEESRSISYVAFSRAPSTADTADTRNKIMALKSALDTTHDIKELLQREGVNNFYDGLISNKIIQVPNKDSIFKTPVGQVYGPYFDGRAFSFAKVLEVKPMADTVKVRHILIATLQQDPQSGQMQQVRNSATARKLADSIRTLIQNGQNFDSLLVKFSDDKGSVDKGGVYDDVVSGRMVSPFNDFIFTHPVGTKDVVMTEFGYHYIEILSSKGSSTGYKIAYLPKAIVTSAQTDQKASNDANEFAADSRDQKAFDATFDAKWKPKGYVKGVAPSILPTAYNLPGIGVSRAFVKKIYQAKAGDVLQPEAVGENYIVAVVTEVNKEGTQSVAKARALVEPLLINKKKAELLKAKIGKITTLEAAAAALGKPIQTVDSLRMSSRTPLIQVYEPRVNGAVFNPANKGKVVPEVLEGKNGVYVVRVDNVTATAVTNANISEQRKAFYQQTKQSIMQAAAYGQSQIMDALKSGASITDKRADRF